MRFFHFQFAQRSWRTPCKAACFALGLLALSSFATGVATVCGQQTAPEADVAAAATAAAEDGSAAANPQLAAPSTTETAPAADERSAAPEEKPQPRQFKPDGEAANAATGPPIYYLPDEQGNLRRVIGYQYEDFLKAQGQTAANPQPDYLLETSRTVGFVGNEFAELVVTFVIVPVSDGPFVTPIQLGSTIVQDVEFTAESSHSALAFDPRTNSYALWLEGRRGEKQTIVLNLIKPIQHSTGQRRLSLQLPRAAEATMDLEVDGDDVEISATGAPLVPQALGKDEKLADKLIRVAGAVGAIDVVWTPKLEERAAQQRFSATLDLQVSIEPDQLEYQCRFEAQTNGQSVDRFQIELPEGFELAEEFADESYQVRQLSAPSDATHRRLVEVRLPIAETTPPIVSFAARRHVAAHDGQVVRTLAAPRVLEAYQQSGQIAVVLGEQLQCYFDLAGRINQIAVNELPSRYVDSNPTAAFSYSGVDWKLLANTQPRQRRVRVRPEYQLSIDGNEATLDVDLEYQISGARLFGVRVDLRGWQQTYEPVESGGLVDRSQIQVKHGDILVLPLLSPVDETLNVRFALRRELTPGANELPLPTPQSAFVMPGELEVQSAPSIQVAPNADATVGLALLAEEQAAPAEGVQTPAIDDSGKLQYSVYAAEPTLGVLLAARPRSVAVEASVLAEVLKDRVKLTQQWHYQVRYEALDEMTLQVPRQLWNTGRLRFSYDGEDLPMSAIRVVDEEKLEIAVTPPRRLLGEGTLSMHYELPMVLQSLGFPTQVDLPLASPRVPITTMTAQIKPAEAVTVVLGAASGERGWTLAPGAAPPLLRLSTQTAASALPLLVRTTTGRNEGVLQQQRCWAQTWFSGKSRQDRFVYRLSSNRRQLVVNLPQRISELPLEVRLNGKRVPVRRLKDEQLAVELPARDEPAEFTLEIRLHRKENLLQVGQAATEVPTLSGVVGVTPFYWQLVVPEEICTTSTPESLTAEYRLGWNNYRWGRQPLLHQSDLERWTDATALQITPSQGENEYLYSSIETPTTIKVSVVRRVWLNLAGVAGLFLIGMIAIYTTLWRSAAFWGALSAGLLWLAISQPQLAVWLLQAILAVGCCLVLVVGLRRLLTVKSPDLPFVSPSTQSISIQTAGSAQWPDESQYDSAATVAPTLPAPPSGASR